MAQNPKKKKRRLPKNVSELPDREVMERIFGKRVVKELDKLTDRPKDPPEDAE